MNIWLKEIREQKNLTMLQVSHGCKIAESYYCQIENGNRNPSVETAKKIADVLGFDWTRFYEDDLLKEEREEQSDEDCRDSIQHFD